MDSVATIELPFPPSVNHYWRSCVIKGRVSTYISKAGKEYRTAVKVAVLQRWPKLTQPLQMRLCVEITVVQPDRRKRDLDNLGKGLLDGLKHAGVYEDDSLIDQLTYIRSGVIQKPGFVRVAIREFSLRGI